MSDVGRTQEHGGCRKNEHDVSVEHGSLPGVPNYSNVAAPSGDIGRLAPAQPFEDISAASWRVLCALMSSGDYKSSRAEDQTLRHHLVRIDHELLSCALVKIFVALRRFIE
jgi:hypothetical protein